MSNARARFIGALFIFLGLISSGVYWATRNGGLGEQNSGITKAKLAKVLGNSASFIQFPAETEFENERVVIQYAFDAKLQDEMERLFRAYKPDYGAFVAVDALTGRILSMVSFSSKTKTAENLTLRATFPSASVFKVVTAAAAIETRKLSADSVIAFNGRNHTLYKGNILKTPINRWTRHMTLREAFARSVNTVFGKIGAFTVGPVDLRLYADRFGFNRPIAADIPVQEGHAEIPVDPQDAWGLAEAASGFTRENTMSPLQGALIAAAVVNDGVMMEPYVVQSIHTMDGNELYEAEPKVGSFAVDPKTASEIRELMRETVTRGTSRRSFRGFFKRDFVGMDVGGKTGSLTGMDPEGKYDWFVGYAEGGAKRIAFAALTIHEKYWRVKSSYIARRAVESYFKDRVGSNKSALKNVAYRHE